MSGARNCRTCQRPDCSSCVVTEFVGLAELLGDAIPVPEVAESDSPLAWLGWDMAVEAQDKRAAR